MTDIRLLLCVRLLLEHILALKQPKCYFLSLFCLFSVAKFHAFLLKAAPEINTEKPVFKAKNKFGDHVTFQQQDIRLIRSQLYPKHLIVRITEYKQFTLNMLQDGRK